MLRAQVPRQRSLVGWNMSAISEQLHELSQQAQDLAQALDVAATTEGSQGCNGIGEPSRGANSSSTLIRNQHRSEEFVDLARLVRARLQTHTGP